MILANAPCVMGYRVYGGILLSYFFVGWCFLGIMMIYFHLF